MVIESRQRDRLEFFTFFLLFIGCVILETIDYGPLANQLKPAFVSMMICFWVMQKPEVVPLGLIWAMGLIVDLVVGSYLGEHAFGKFLVGWLMAQGASRIRLGTLIQQAFYIFLFILAEYSFYWIVGLIVGDDSLIIIPLIKATVSSLTWPFIFTIFSVYWSIKHRLFR